MKTLVLIPTYNEKDNIPILVADLMAIPGVLGDGARRSIAGRHRQGRRRARREVSRAASQALHRTGQRGLGVSYLEGFHRAIDSDSDFVCQMDADLSHDPKYLPEMIAQAAAGADLVIGSRYLNGISVVNWPLRRIILSSFANFYIRTVTGLHMRDITTGYRCWRRAVARQAAARSHRLGRLRVPARRHVHGRRRRACDRRIADHLHRAAASAPRSCRAAC